MKKRYKLSKRKSKRDFKRKSKMNKMNFKTYSRGGIRL